MDGIDRDYRSRVTEGPSGETAVRDRANLEKHRGDFLSVPAFGIFAPVLGSFAKSGRLDVDYRDTAHARFDDGAGPHYRMRIESLRMIWRVMRNPDLGCGESYMDGLWKLEQGDLGGFLGLTMRNEAAMLQTRRGRALTALGWLISRTAINNPEKSRENAAHHYDIGNDLYEAFLDKGMNYSCAFFETPDQPLRDAQLNKQRVTVSRLTVAPNMRVLDIGSGWGELTRTIAGETDAAHIVGITLAKNQLELARRRAADRFGNRLAYRLADYRVHAGENPGAYDRIVSVGMFEHVGRRYFIEYFAMIRRMLSDNGQSLVHSIMRQHRAETSPWIKKYIFPGGYIPTLEDTVAAALEAGLELVHEPFVHKSFHYAQTLRLWRRNFSDAWPGLDHARYDERFRRMWDFYLACSEAAFDANGMNVAQVLLRKA
jgi:cyclopropane-fatty-acyl-phospholipid synthase